jgi:hypothetical protein
LSRMASRNCGDRVGWLQIGPAGVTLGCIRGRDGHRWPPPAQIRTSGIPASGSYLECLTAKRTFGQG